MLPIIVIKLSSIKKPWKQIHKMGKHKRGWEIGVREKFYAVGTAYYMFPLAPLPLRLLDTTATPAGHYSILLQQINYKFIIFPLFQIQSHIWKQIITKAQFTRCQDWEETTSSLLYFLHWEVVLCLLARLTQWWIPPLKEGQQLIKKIEKSEKSYKMKVL